jgi:hypothetical protein
MNSNQEIIIDLEVQPRLTWDGHIAKSKPEKLISTARKIASEDESKC